MTAPSLIKRGLPFLATVCGSSLLVVCWLVAKFCFGVEDRYLPTPAAVARAFHDVDPPFLVHVAATGLRVLCGGAVGLALGVGLAILMHWQPLLRRLLSPSVQALRSVPAVATIPFFLLWFGFEEKGKILLVLLGLGLNVLVAAYQVLHEMPSKYVVALSSFGHSKHSFPMKVALPLVVERILPAVRASLSIAFGVVVVSEILGSQRGLGYLIQTSKSTYAIHVIFLATIVLGALNVIADSAIQIAWRRLAYWQQDSRRGPRT